MNSLKYLIFATLLCNVLSHHSDWTQGDKVSKTENIKFTLIIKNENTDKLNQLFSDISNPYHNSYGEYMKYSEIVSIINPTNNQYYDIQGLNKMNGFKCKFYGDAFRCTSSIEQVEKVFKVEMYEYKNIKKGTILYRSLNDYVLPEEYGDILFVDGLSNYLFPLPKYTTKSIHKKIYTDNNTPDSRYFGRETVNMFYNLTSYKPSKNVSVAAWEYMEGGYVQSFMNVSQTYNGVSALRNVGTLVGVNAPDDVETDLDLEMLLNYDGVNVYYGQTNGWLIDGYYDMLNIALKGNLPDVISISYGWNEYEQCDIAKCTNETSAQYVKQCNYNFLKLGLMGYTLVISSGDAGSKGRTDETCQTNTLYPDFPGSSPYVISVGATFTVQSNTSLNMTSPLCSDYGCITGNYTVPVSYDYVGWTTGGHFDGYNNASHWELHATQEYLNSGVYLPNASWNRYGHGVPTVVMNGHNCPVYGAYGSTMFTAVDGTSCSSPLFAGFLAYVNDFQLQNGRKVVGPAQQLLYLLAYGYPDVFMRSGNGHTYCTEQMCCSTDNGFQTPPVKTTWNPVYGLGQPNFGFMTTALNSMFS